MSSKPRSTRQLGPDDFISAATEIVRAHGLEAFTMRHLADALGVSPMAAYRHFPSKTDLFAAMIDQVWAAAIGTVEAQDDADPVEAIVQSLVGVRQRLIDQGELTLLVAGPPPETRSEALVRLWEAGLQRLRNAGFAESELHDLQRLLGRVTATSAIAESAAFLSARLTGRVDPDARQASAEIFERSIRLLLGALLAARDRSPD